MLKFSLLIAQYNNGKFFKECYESIINQSYQDFEIVILDDCSTDNSLDIIKDLVKNDTRFKIFENKENRGCGFTKKKLVELSTGDICGFLDPDDTLSNDAIEKSIEAYQDEKIVATYSKFMLCDKNLNPQKKHPNSKQVEPFDIYFFNTEINISHFFTFKKNIYFKTEGINPLYKIAEDMDIILKIYEKGNVKFIDKVLYNYRIHNTGVSSLKNNLKAKVWFTIVIFEACKRRKIDFPIDNIIRNVLGILPEKYEFSKTKFFKIIFHTYRLIKWK